MSVTPIAERESNSLAIESDPIKLVSRDSESLSTSNISKLNNKKPERDPKISPIISWQSVVVKPGDSLALIFSRLGLGSNSLFQIMSLGKETSILKTLVPGDKLEFHIVDNELIALKYEMELTKILKIFKKDKKFVTENIKIELDSIV